MIDDAVEFQQLVHTVTEIAKADKIDDLIELLSSSQITVSQTEYDNWNGGTYGYTIYVSVDVKTFINFKNKLESTESLLFDRFAVAIRLLHAHIKQAYYRANKSQNSFTL